MNRKSLFFLCLAVVAAVVIYEVSPGNFDWSLFVSNLWNVQPAWLAASIAATLLTYVARAFRWQVLLNPVKSVRVNSLISTNILGFSAIFLLGRAGELVRPLWLTRQEQVPLSASLATILIERLLDFLMVIALFGGALLIVEVPRAAQANMAFMKSKAWILIAGSAAAIVFTVFFRSNIERIVKYVRIQKIASLLRHFAEGLSFVDNTGTFFLAVLHSVSVWITIVLQFWFMLLGMNFHFSISAATFVLVIVAIASVFQIPGFGGGFQAGYIFCMMTFFAVSKEDASATALMAWVLSNVPTTIVAGFYMISHGLSLKDLRTATAE